MTDGTNEAHPHIHSERVEIFQEVSKLFIPKMTQLFNIFKWCQSAHQHKVKNVVHTAFSASLWWLSTVLILTQCIKSEKNNCHFKPLIYLILGSRNVIDTRRERHPDVELAMQHQLSSSTQFPEGIGSGLQLLVAVFLVVT